VPDRFIWRWTVNGKYSAFSAYRSFFIGMSTMIGAKQLWKVKVPPKVKLFFWITLHSRLWTAERRWRHGLQQHGTCVLCDQDLETTDHLLASCAYARETWYRCLQLAGMETLPQGDVTLVDWWLTTRKVGPTAARRLLRFRGVDHISEHSHLGTFTRNVTGERLTMSREHRWSSYVLSLTRQAAGLPLVTPACRRWSLLQTGSLAKWVYFLVTSWYNPPSSGASCLSLPSYHYQWHLAMK
jgi:hypothetical protein